MKNQIRINQSTYQVVQCIEEQDADLVWVLVKPAERFQNDGNGLRANISKVSS